jgi:hypothetical protein
LTTGTREVLAEGACAAMIEIAQSKAGSGAFLLFRMRAGAIAKHVGILTEVDRFIHAYERLGVIEEPLTMAWRRRVAFAFLFPRALDLQPYRANGRLPRRLNVDPVHSADVDRVTKQEQAYGKSPGAAYKQPGLKGHRRLGETQLCLCNPE